MKRWLRRILVVLLVAGGLVVLRFTVFRPQPVPVTVYRVATGLVEDIVTNSKAGTIRTRHRAALSPEIGGRVAQLSVHEGDRVETGQLLMKLADADYRAQVELSRRALEAAAAADEQACLLRDQAQRDYDRNVRLKNDQIVSEELLEQLANRRDTAQANCQASRAEVAKARAALELARVNLQKTIIRAPFGGVITEITSEVGEWITPSPTGVPLPAVIELIDPDALYVDSPLDEVDVGKVRVGQPVRISLDAYPGQTFPGRVTRVAPFVRDMVDQNRTFDVEIDFDDPQFARTLLPGTSADVEVILESIDEALRLPSYALMEGGRVLVLEDGILASRTVETGLRNWEFTEIRSGLSAGELVVVSLDRVEVQEGAAAEIEQETEK